MRMILLFLVGMLAPGLWASSLGPRSECQVLLYSKFTLTMPRLLRVGNRKFQFRRANVGDVSVVTTLVRRAYAIWPEVGINVGSPTTQTDELTKSYLLDHGFVLLDSEERIIATVSLEEAKIGVCNDEVSVVRRGKPDTYTCTGSGIKPDQLAGASFLYLYRLAVDRTDSGLGIGKMLMSVVEEHARKSAYQGIILDTQTNARWLYEWYKRLGFEDAGSSAPEDPDDPITVMMVKKF